MTDTDTIKKPSEDRPNENVFAPVYPDDTDGTATPSAAPSPPSTPGLVVPAAAGPALTPPAPSSTPGAPVQSWLCPAPA
jgi:hypothetical protein